MGKWCFMSATFAPNYEALMKEVKDMPEEQLNAEWKALGEPMIMEYGLSTYSGISGDGWATIDNSADPGYRDNPLQLFVSREDFVSQNPARMDKWYRRACVLAHRLGLRKRLVL